jgi:hypothetical protein
MTKTKSTPRWKKVLDQEVKTIEEVKQKRKRRKKLKPKDALLPKDPNPARTPIPVDELQRPEQKFRAEKKRKKKGHTTYKKPFKMKHGGKVGDSIKTYSNGGYVEGK